MSNELKYYLISFSYQNIKLELQNEMKVTTHNPLEWILQVTKEDQDRRESHLEKYVLLNFWELTEEQYKRMKRVIG